MNNDLRRAADPAYRTIVVPLDGSDFSIGALPTARALAARFDATVHTVTVAVSGFDRQRIRSDAARALGTDPDDPRIHVEVDADVAAAVHRRAASLDSPLVCLASRARGRVAGTAIGSTARDIIERGLAPVVVVGPVVVRPDPEHETPPPPLAVDRLVACVDGTPASERGLAVAAAWAHALGMKLTINTVAEPCPPPLRIGAPWRRHHGPAEDADEYVRRLVDHWALDAPGVDGGVVYDPIGVASGMRDHLASHPAGLVAVTSNLRDRLPHLMVGSGAADIVHASTVPVLVVPSHPEAG